MISVVRFICQFTTGASLSCLVISAFVLGLSGASGDHAIQQSTSRVVEDIFGASMLTLLVAGATWLILRIAEGPAEAISGDADDGLRPEAPSSRAPLTSEWRAR